jgi:hypothetical protein
MLSWFFYQVSGRITSFKDITNWQNKNSSKMKNISLTIKIFFHIHLCIEHSHIHGVPTTLPMYSHCSFTKLALNLKPWNQHIWQQPPSHEFGSTHNVKLWDLKGSITTQAIASPSQATQNVHLKLQRLLSILDVNCINIYKNFLK